MQTRIYRFFDLHSGGYGKTPYSHLYIEAPSEEMATSLFQAMTGCYPYDVTCECCGKDFSVAEEVSLDQATGFERNCAWDKYTEMYVDDEAYRIEYMTLSDFLNSGKVFFLPYETWIEWEFQDDQAQAYFEAVVQADGYGSYRHWMKHSS